MRYEEANATPMSKVSAQKTEVAPPLWISAYVNVYLSYGKYFDRYLESREDALMSDTDFQSLFDRRAEMARNGEKGIGNGQTNRIETLVSAKFLHAATKLLEKELRQNMPRVTKTPGFYLLLSSYETLHANGYRPSLFDAKAPKDATYLNLVQALLELFPEDTRSDVHEYLATFQSSGDESDFRSSLMSRIDYEGDMERIVDRGRRRQAAVDGLMSRIRTSIREKADAREE